MSKYRILQTGQRQFIVQRKYLFWWVHLREYVGGEVEWWNRLYFTTAKSAKDYILNKVKKEGQESEISWKDTIVEEFET
jgi:hypothetical protein